MLRSRVAKEGSPVNADLDHGLAVIERNARAQGKLIEDVMDVARVVSGKFRLDRRPCDLGVMVHAAADAVRPAALAKSIAMDVHAEPAGGTTPPEILICLCDGPRLSQAILNLLNNAVKFTPKGGRVAMHLERDGDRARVTVSDTGKGIPKDFLPFIFDRFKQAEEGSTRGSGGLGLGLTIVRHIVELHGGTVSVASDGEGTGASFTMELPVHLLGVEETSTYTSMQSIPAVAAQSRSWADEVSSPVHVAASPPPQPPAVKLEGVRVLIVDDELDSRTVARLALESAGATVVTASSAAEAYKLAIRGSPEATVEFPPMHVLVSDLGMPGEDGYSLVRRLRAEGVKARDLPAVALTAFVSPEDRRRALLAGFQVHMAKPVDPHELVAAVGSLAGRTGV